MQGVEMDIARNVKVVDRLQADLASSLANLYQAMVKGETEEALTALVDLNVFSLLMTKRLGVSLGKLEVKTSEKVVSLLKEGHPAEEYGDLTALKAYIEMKR